MFAMLDADADRKKRTRHQQPAEVNHQSSSPRIQSADDVRDETGAWQNTASLWEYDYHRRRQIDHDYYRRSYHDYIHDYFTSAEEALLVEAMAAHVGVEGVQEQGCAALYDLARNNPSTFSKRNILGLT